MKHSVGAREAGTPQRAVESEDLAASLTTRPAPRSLLYVRGFF